MDLKNYPNQMGTFIKKYKYAVVVLVVGILLMWFPSFGASQNTVTGSQKAESDQVSVEVQLKNILSQIRGVGAVEVMLKERKGEEIIYQTDEDTVISNDSSSVRVNTITITDDNRNDSGLIRQIIPPDYQGAIVICQGADDITVKLSVIEAVSKITGLGSNKIAVLKMK